MPDSFTFILSHVNSNITQPVKIINSHKFRRANTKEVKKIKEIIRNFYPNKCFGSFYEQTVKQSRETGKQKYIELNESEWRYWVVSFKGNNDKIEDLSLAASLLKNDLEFGFTIIGDLPDINNPNDEYPGNIFNYQKLSSFFDSKAIYKHGAPEITEITEDEIIDIGLIYQMLINRKEKDFFLDIALQRWKYIKTLPRDSDLMIIGLISIIECLITHKPTSSGGPSINHQIKTKMTLLSRRLKRPLEYESFFKKDKADIIWKNIYKYRSDIVHGNEEMQNVPQVLIDKNQVINFLTEATKLLILTALSETDLVADLKNC